MERFVIHIRVIVFSVPCAETEAETADDVPNPAENCMNRGEINRKLTANNRGNSAAPVFRDSIKHREIEKKILSGCGDLTL